MKAITKYKYGSPEVLNLEEVDKPIPSLDEILVKVKANSANPADWHIMRGKPFLARLAFGLFKPKNKTLGTDFSGVVESTGDNVNQFKVGDKVFSESMKAGAFAQYLVISPEICAQMPKTSSFNEMAALPMAGLTAIQAVVDHGKVKKGERVLINGASGGVGHLCVQIAQSMGAEVTGVCSQRNESFVKSIGAQEVIAHDKTNIHHHNTEYDLVLDIHGNLTFEDFKRMGKRGVIVGFTTMNALIKLKLKSVFNQFPLAQFTAKANAKDLNKLADLVEQKRLQPHIEKLYTFNEIPEAIAYIEKMRTRGKVVIEWK